ncbi:MAG: hypothetical protein KAY22_17805 [Rhizorhabdus sp.]|jgi:hypothetical protein|uniref:hypothetical protein n=2 Tax=Rhizorhabdus sp. TaxID=1968843 RepID=UPI001B41B011|nr:hypothetical protein [Rhizorhabdus sp.]MBP8234156.1 hypothetical protein [Rhizorhabdus sp.]
MSAMMYRLTDIRRRIDEEIRSELSRRTPSFLRLLRLRRLNALVRERLSTRLLTLASA